MCCMLRTSRSLWCTLVHFILLLNTNVGTLLAAAPLSPEPLTSIFPWPTYELPKSTAAATELQKSGLIIQVVIPKTGSSTMKFALTPVWRALSAMNASTTDTESEHKPLFSGGGNGGGAAASPFETTTTASGLPFLAGNCGAPHNDGVERCVGSRFFPCLTPAPPPAAAVTATSTNAVVLASRCRFRPPEQHLTATEVMWGFTGERGLSFWSQVLKQQQGEQREREQLPPLSSLQPFASTQPRVMTFTMLRSPANRVISEFHHWQRNWCCGWFFSANLVSQRANLTLSDFINHPDCPANNRQVLAWMLADLPLLQLSDTSSSLGLKGALSPSQFPLYFKAFYGGAEDYVDKLNNDDAILRSAESFVSRADVIGLTEQMPLTLAMFLIAIPAARQHLFVWRADNHDIGSSSSSGGNSKSGSSSWSSSSTSSSSWSSSSSSSSSSASGSSRSGCWQFRRQSEVGAVPAPKEAHTRAVAYPSAPTPSEVTLARARNRLDLSLYAHAAEVHSKLRATYQLCSDQPVHGE